MCLETITFWQVIYLTHAVYINKSKLVMSGTSVPVECFLVLLLFLSGSLVLRLEGTTDTMDTVRVWNDVIAAALSMSRSEPGGCMSKTSE